MLDPEFVDVAAVDDVPENGVLSIALPSGEHLCLVRFAGVISALVDCCPHQGMPLSAGEVMSDGTLQCAWHGARFDCHSGAVRQGPAEDDVATRGVHVEGGRVWVRGD